MLSHTPPLQLMDAMMRGLSWSMMWMMCLAAGTAWSQTPEKWLARGDSLMTQDKPQRALAEYEQAVKADAGVRPLLSRAKAWWALERMDRFILDIERVLRMDSTQAEAHLLRARYSARGEDALKTVYHASEAINHGTDTVMHVEALVLRGKARADMKLPAQAIDDLELAMAGGAADVEAMTILSRLYDKAGRYTEALSILERLCEMEPANVGHWSNRGFELIQLQRYDEALIMIEKALSLDKDEPVALSNRAYVQMKLGNSKAAWADVERSLRAYPANPYALRTRAILRIQGGDTSKACDDLVLAKAMAVLPDVDVLIQENCLGRDPDR